MVSNALSGTLALAFTYPVMTDIVVAIVSAVLSAIAAFFAARQSFRQELLSAYDETMRTARIEAYKGVWVLTGILPKFAQTAPVDAELLKSTSVKMRDWYFSGSGMFLTDKSRDAYFDLQKQIAHYVAVLAHVAPRPLSEPEYELLRLCASTLRSNLCTDLNSRMQPVLTTPPSANA